MTIARWLAAAEADADRRGLPELKPLLRISGIEPQVGAACLQHTQRAHYHLQRTFKANAYHHVRTNTLLSQERSR